MLIHEARDCFTGLQLLQYHSNVTSCSNKVVLLKSEVTEVGNPLDSGSPVLTMIVSILSHGPTTDHDWGCFMLFPHDRCETSMTGTSQGIVPNLTESR